MTRKHYIKLAGAINKLSVRPEAGTEADRIADVVGTLCDVLKSDNKRFERERFLDACFLKRS